MRRISFARSSGTSEGTAHMSTDTLKHGRGGHHTHRRPASGPDEFQPAGTAARRRFGGGGRRWVVFGAGAAAGGLLLALLVGRVEEPGPPGPVFADEFGGDRVDFGTWRSGYPWGCTNQTSGERQCYTPDALEVRDGVLRITADRPGPGGYPYRSGMITSYQTFAQTYGYFEMRARVPRGKGLWPAFWLLPAVAGKWPPELDVMEVFGSQPARVLMAQHYRDGAGRPADRLRTWAGPDFSAGFHTFAISWSASSVVWYVDGVERFRSRRDVPDEPMYVLVNLAVGGDAPGQPDAGTRFPSVLEVDYVRVWDSPTRPGDRP
jgi:beta-glucanase (GH16 family)